MKIYLVGGAVRDQLLGLDVKEKDWVVVGATPEQMVEKGFKPVGKDFPVFLHPKTKEEYALARTERKVSRGYKGFDFYAASDVTLEQDLKRRDLTINAIAQDESGQLIDPFQGSHDLKNKILRHVSDAFSEDPVRILRLARFYARFYQFGFKIADTTILLMREMVANGEVKALVAERVWQEMHRALGENNPEKFFEALRYCGALKVIIPELDNLFGVPNPPKHHPEIDTGVHTLMVLQQATKLSNDGSVRFAALMHDLGKALTPMNEWPKHVGHEQKGVSLVKELCKRLRVPKDYRDLAIIVAREHGKLHKIEEMREATLVKFLESLDAYRREQRLEKFILACSADSKGRPGFEDREYIPGKILWDAYLKTKNIDIKPLLEKGLTGKALANAIHEKRVKALKNR